MRTLLVHLSVFAVGVACFFLQGPGWTRHLHDRLGSNGDAILNAWILAWDAHALAHPDRSVWDAPIFYPVPNTLTFSETMFGNLWITLPVQYLTGNLILAANLFTFAAFVLGLYATFLLVHRLTGSYLAGVVSGLLFSFNPIRWGQLAHMNLLPFFWAPLALYCCHRFLETRRAKPFFGMVLAQVCQYYTSMNLGTILLTTLVLFGGLHCLLERRGMDRFFFVTDRHVRRLLTAGLVLGFVLMLPLGVRYLQTVRSWDFVRTESDNAAYSCEPLSFLVPGPSFGGYHAWHAHFAGRVRTYAGLGLAPWLFAAAGGVLVRRGTGQFSEEQTRLVRRLTWLVPVLAVCMLGPTLIWFDRPLSVPLPYELVYHLMPGAKAMRVPARFFLPLLLCLATLAGFAVAHVTVSWRQWGPGRKALVAVCVAGWLGWDYAVTANDGFALPTPEQFPPVYSYLAKGEPGRPVLELPAGWDGQFDYLYYQTAHWRPLVAGSTGNFTQGILQTTLRTQSPLTEDTLRFLHLSPTMTLVVHLDRYEPSEAAAWRDAPLDHYGFRYAGRFGDAAVWERSTAPPATSPKLRVLRSAAHLERRLCLPRLFAEVEVRAADTRLPWRCLERGYQEVEITLTDDRGRPHRYTRPLEIPPYLLPGQTAVLKLNPITGVPADIRHLSVRGPLLEDYEEDVRPKFR